MSEEDRERRGGHAKRLAEDIEGLVGDINKVVRVAVTRGSDAAETLGETVRDGVKDAIGGVRPARDSVVMIRVDKDSLARLDDLVESEISGSRSEAGAYLITEGIKARQPLFDKIAGKIEQIRRAKDELRTLLEDEETGSAQGAEKAD